MTFIKIQNVSLMNFKHGLKNGKHIISFKVILNFTGEKKNVLFLIFLFSHLKYILEMLYYSKKIKYQISF